MINQAGSAILNRNKQAGGKDQKTKEPLDNKISSTFYSLDRSLCEVFECTRI